MTVHLFWTFGFNSNADICTNVQYNGQGGIQGQKSIRTKKLASESSVRLQKWGINKEHSTFCSCLYHRTGGLIVVADACSESYREIVSAQIHATEPLEPSRCRDMDKNQKKTRNKLKVIFILLYVQYRSSKHEP
jgi:hypothetical protein